MFNFFHRKASTPPEFHQLKSYLDKDKYFYRIAKWDWLSKTQITIYDANTSRLITLDDWPQLVFLDANGKLTISEYIEYLGAQYDNKIPEGLDDTVIKEVESLLKEGLIALSDKEVELDEVFKNPLSKHTNNP